jgi:mRNA-degrading endonuclease RelE of RelBE toxin-antitoxin system
VTYTLIWTHAAVAGLIRLRAADPLLAKTVRGAVGALADNPCPDTSTTLGSTNQRRLRVGVARVIYTVSEENVSVDILTVGRTHA